MARILQEINSYLDQVFDYARFKDSSLNGLQLDSRKENITKIGAAVDFGISTARTAADLGVDLMITHHGLLWGANETFTGTFGDKVKLLYDNCISLIAIHLPLDAHEKYGNNILIASEILSLGKLEPAISFAGSLIGWKGENLEKKSLVDMAGLLSAAPGGLVSPRVISFGRSIPKKVCVVSGSAADVLYRFKDEDFDTLITGEARQFAYHFCKENHLNVIFAGHYATETFGVRARKICTADTSPERHTHEV
jgi:dinuclear metal center YbgI/SA1388 family protein